ncbi:BREX-1 system adenine-specific DNA-methyltransferase PglX [Lactobacillus amylovorus]|uniref:BREX-1 system adenine-specific DNA-methyltransferase PglX n=1 Tax=Lactobacillus amylovorus TaxID=1604 RepID=UPI00232B7659|nr:BREX-1 system adenine-specific DNA-methyltransferase PglX [Lactobacillus amylovorus]MDB6252165.1 BREX-1 system adenine-specific DNA-methyltransferase PglX [Lactobacillus amylovorus]MDB6270690.1 BREX-1 system adenine-specific DNA-methyltransferase PglX [Lactobacillus amylovorus]
MDKNKIKKYAINARTELINAIKVKLATLGIDENEIQDKLSISTPDKEYYVDDNEANALTGAQIGWRKDIVAELNRHGYQEDSKTAYKDFVEEVAYTWFNRIIAIRFMEVNNYLPSRVRVLSSEEGKNEPDIINEAMEIGDDLGGYSNQEKELITTALTEKTPELMDSLYTMLFIKQCDALSEILPGLFEETSNYLKLLFTPHYDRGVIKELIDEIPEEYFDVEKEGQVQIIGWLYQYYNTIPKENSFKKKKYQTDDIPPVTQLFTPDWLVRYMVENSLGRYWIDILHAKGDSRSEKDIASEFNWKYYMPSSEKNKVEICPELASKEVTDIKFIDPAMGSGHILIYAFDILMQIYETQGYSRRDAATSIIKNNLYGLDIDKRAYQLSYFALLMKAREYNRRVLRRHHTVNLYDVPEVKYTIKDYTDLISNDDLDKKTVEDLDSILNVFQNGNDLGSIIKVNKNIDFNKLRELFANNPNQNNEQPDLFIDMRTRLNTAINIAEVLSNTYDVSVTNPPYMGGGKMDPPLKKYVQKNYPIAKADMFSVFIEKMIELTSNIGYIGMITMHSWMFLSNFEKLRKEIQNHTIINMAHLGTRAFGDIGGEVVQTTTFILQKAKREEYLGSYERLVDYGSQDDKEEMYLETVNGKDDNDIYHVDQSNFDKIPGSPIAYWASENLINDFEKGTPLGELVDAKQGLATADNKRFLRQWFEVGIDNISFDSHSIKDSVESGKKWFPLNKGGAYRKWYGNNFYVVNWKNNGYEMKHFLWPNGKQRSVIRNPNFYFKSGITIPSITSGKVNSRVYFQGFIFDHAAASLFIKTGSIYSILSFLNSNIVDYLINILNPTINSGALTFSKLPVLKFDDLVTMIGKKNVVLTKQDWDAFETSWDFQKSPLLTQSATSLHQAYNSWSNEALTRFNQLKSNEEKLNRIFINLYGLQDELTPEEDDKEVSVRKADQVRDIKAFLSYFIGCVFGRYSLDQDGLVYAGGDWDTSKYSTFKPNKENIILLTDRQYFDDDRDIIVRLKEFLTKTFDSETLTENMDFIAQTLEPKKFERGTSAEDIIRTYFLNDFYKDHAKIYQKRPIYWEFNSGRNKGFKALMYLHRYNTEELPMVRHYLHELQPAMNDLIEVDQNLLEQETTASVKSKYRKAIANLNKQMNEIMKYDQILDHLSQDPIDLDLDDGVLVNHDKLQQGEKLLSKL